MRYTPNMPTPRLPYAVTVYYAACAAAGCHAGCVGHQRLDARHRGHTIAQASRVLARAKQEDRVTGADLTLGDSVLRWWRRTDAEAWPRTQEGAPAGQA